MDLAIPQFPPKEHAQLSGGATHRFQHRGSRPDAGRRLLEVDKRLRREWLRAYFLGLNVLRSRAHTELGVL